MDAFIQLPRSEVAGRPRCGGRASPGALGGVDRATGPGFSAQRWRPWTGLASGSAEQGARALQQWQRLCGEDSAGAQRAGPGRPPGKSCVLARVPSNLAKLFRPAFLTVSGSSLGREYLRNSVQRLMLGKISSLGNVLNKQ